jgi:hypothetical protein
LAALGSEAICGSELLAEEDLAAAVVVHAAEDPAVAEAHVAVPRLRRGLHGLGRRQQVGLAGLAQLVLEEGEECRRKRFTPPKPFRIPARIRR